MLRSLVFMKFLSVPEHQHEDSESLIYPYYAIRTIYVVAIATQTV